MAEFRASKAALMSVSPSSYGKGTFLGISADDAAAALDSLEGTYFLRMTAEAERAMRLHLATHFPAVKVSTRDGFGRLIGKCAKNFDPAQPGVRMPLHLVAEVKILTGYRNDQAHSPQSGFVFPDLGTSRIRLSRFLYALP